MIWVVPVTTVCRYIPAKLKLGEVHLLPSQAGGGVACGIHMSSLYDFTDSSDDTLRMI